MRRPCEVCRALTNSAAARASGELRPGKKHVHVRRNVISTVLFAGSVCDRCWERHLELGNLSDDEVLQRTLVMARDWLERSPELRGDATRRRQELSITEAARQCATAASYSLADGHGILRWAPGERRFRFSLSNGAEPFTPALYDDVLIRPDHAVRVYDDDPEILHSGSVRQAGGNILLLWRLMGDFADHSG